jgi:calcium-independent phospholipase A2-gamma
MRFTGDLSMAGSSRLDSPKVAIIASLVSDNKGIVPYVFRNYNFPAMVTSNYRGSVRYKVWEAVRASSAAPGYFDECYMNKKIFQDGGVSSNNATHIGIHEAQKLWPTEPIQCV